MPASGESTAAGRVSQWERSVVSMSGSLALSRPPAIGQRLSGRLDPRGGWPVTDVAAKSAQRRPGPLRDRPATTRRSRLARRMQH